MQQWHLIYTKPHKEVLVNEQLQTRDLETFFPTFQIERGYSRGVRLEPFFPHYIFAKIDLEAQHATGLQWLVGVRSLVQFEGRPVVIPESLIWTLRENLEPQIAKNYSEAEWRFEPSQRVRIKSGPFVGLEAIFQKGLSGKERVQVLLELLGTWTRVELNVQQLEAA